MVEQIKQFLANSIKLFSTEMEKNFVVEVSRGGKTYHAFFPKSKCDLLKTYKEKVQDRKIDLLRIYEFNVKKNISYVAQIEFENIKEVDLNKIESKNNFDIEKVKKYVEQKIEKHLLF